jgi:DNA polymerase-3 subunit alpha
MKLVSIGYLEGFITARASTRKYSHSIAAGLIALSACLKGEVAGLIQQKRFNDALKSRRDLPGDIREGQLLPGDTSQFHTRTENRKRRADQNLQRIKFPLVATMTVHYPSKDKSEAHEALVVHSDPNHP